MILHMHLIGILSLHMHRFLEMYGFSKACSGRIQDVAGLAVAQLPEDVGEKLLKHMNAAQIAGYVGLNAIGQGSPYRKVLCSI